MAAEDTAGNILGFRDVFDYETDDGLSKRFTGDASVNLAIGNVINVNRALPNVSPTARRPLKLRYMLLRKVALPNQIKRVIVGDPLNPLWTSGSNDLVEINGQDYRVTTRVGERRGVE